MSLLSFAFRTLAVMVVFIGCASTESSRVSTDGGAIGPAPRIDATVRDVVDGAPATIDARLSPDAPPGPDAAPNTATLTQSSSQVVLSANSVSCVGDLTGYHADNSYYRVFDLADFNITAPFQVTSVEFGVEESASTSGTQPVDVILHALANGSSFTVADLVEIGRHDESLGDLVETTHTVPVSATVPVGSQLVVEIFTPDGRTMGNTFFIGSNQDGESAPSYLRAADCGVTEPTLMTALTPNIVHMVINVTGMI